MGRAQELLLSHLHGPQNAILLALPAEPRAREPPGGRRKRVCKDPAEQGRQSRLYLVGVNPTKYTQHVRNVLRASASAARRSEGRIVQAGEGPIPILSRERRRRLQRRACARTRKRWEGAPWPKALKTRPVVACSRSLTCAIGACKGVRLAAVLLPRGSLTGKLKYQIFESQSTQVRQRFMKCDTQLLYGASGPTVSEDGSCKASTTCALHGYVQMRMRSTLCSGDTQQGYPQRKLETNLGSYSVPTQLMSPSHDDGHAITPYLGNKVIFD